MDFVESPVQVRVPPATKKAGNCSDDGPIALVVTEILFVAMMLPPMTAFELYDTAAAPTVAPP